MTTKTYEEWLEARRYRVVRSFGRGHTETLASGLRLEAARSLADQKTIDYMAANPGEDSWTCDLFLVEMETPQWKPKR